MTGPVLSRRRLLGVAGVGLVGAAAGVGGASLVERSGEDTGDRSSLAAAGSATAVVFHGAHQAGIATPVQDRLQITAFDLTTDSRDELVALLREWTRAAEAMTAGRDVGRGAVDGRAEAPPDDTGEALGLPPSRLTLTVGFGPSLFERDGVDRFGLRDARPGALIDLPRFRNDALEPARCGGDIVVQACADDPQVAVHAIRNLARIGFGRAIVRWSQLGFGKTSSTTSDEVTPRNLFGFKDGTNNITGAQHDRLDRHVWVGDEAAGPATWMRGGTYLVARRIGMRIETWDRESLAGQEQMVGRTKREGAPLGQTHERDAVDLSALPADSHVALAHPDANGGHAILRRGYSYVDGSDGLGRLDAGLFFIAFCRDAGVQYVPMQERMARLDTMAEYLVHTGSGLFACPPGVDGPDDYWGRALFEA
ncbi:MAG TPA: iron uptake transporter deferrochelatase/peroxidase subunit [Actinomycetes bacterium]|nr:iron uptake transporter deferrochelatase/peroxidase subunit [Actinomycetes bacterium]